MTDGADERLLLVVELEGRILLTKEEGLLMTDEVEGGVLLTDRVERGLSLLDKME